MSIVDFASGNEALASDESGVSGAMLGNNRVLAMPIKLAGDVSASKLEYGLEYENYKRLLMTVSSRRRSSNNTKGRRL